MSVSEFLAAFEDFPDEADEEPDTKRPRRDHENNGPFDANKLVVQTETAQKNAKMWRPDLVTFRDGP